MSVCVCRALHKQDSVFTVARVGCISTQYQQLYKRTIDGINNMDST